MLLVAGSEFCDPSEAAASFAHLGDVKGLSVTYGRALVLALSEDRDRTTETCSELWTELRFWKDLVSVYLFSQLQEAF